MKGQSMVEVLIAVLVVTLVLTAVVAAILVGIKSAQFSKHKAQATFLAQESMEWLRSEKLGMGWLEFINLASVGGSNYCLTDLNFDNILACDPESDLIDEFYVRDLTLTSNLSFDEVEAEVVVSWYEGEAYRQSPVKTTFYEINLED